MVLKEWGEMQQLYEGVTNRRIDAAKKYWYFWPPMALFVLPLMHYGIALLTDDKFGFRYVVDIVLALLGLLLVGFTLEIAAAKAFPVEYALHGIGHFPFWQRKRYLRYGFFFRDLVNRGYSREMLEKLSTFAMMTGKPEPESRLLQHPAMVPLITILTVLSIEAIKQTALWQKTSYWWLFLVGPIVLLSSSAWVLNMIQLPKSRNQAIQRFLQWAARDIEQEQLLSTWRLRAQAHDSQWPQH